MSSNDSNVSHYDYTPSKALAGVVAGLFGIAFLATFYRLCRKRSWVWLVFDFAILMEVVGYAARVVSAGNVTEKGPYVIQFVLIVLAPVLMAGVIYVIFSRIVFWVVPPESRTVKFLWVPARFVTLIFVGFDIVSLLLQLVAATLIAGTDPTESNAQQKLDLGKDLGIIGVTLQIVGFGFFTIVAARFHFASQKVTPEFASMNKAKNGISKDWRKLLFVVNGSCLLILVRSVYRELEFAGGKDGQTQKAEWYMYVFDTLPIFLVVVAYLIFFPGDYLAYLGFRLAKESRYLPSDSESHNMQESPWSRDGQDQEQGSQPITNARDMV